jgi:large subunit ribosomal protein L23
MPRWAPEAVILQPILSEKTWREMEAGRYTFEVHPKATKPEIREAIEELFKVRVEKVWTMYRPGKPRRTRLDRRHGRTKRRKQAVVKLAPGHKIELAG